MPNTVKPRCKLPPIVLILSMLPGAAPVVAADVQQDKPVAGEDEQPVVLPVITVTANPSNEIGYVATQSTTGTKTDTPLIETPQSISVITRGQLEAQNVNSLAEVLRYTPGIQGETFGFEPRVTQLRIRGLDAATTGLYRDGLQLRNPGFAIGYSLEPYGAERIEVLRGPASVLYGQGSPGGLVNYVSKRPTRQPLHEVEFEAGNFDRLQGKFDLSAPIDEAGVFSYRLTGLVRDSDTQVDFVKDNRIYIAPGFTWRPSEDTTLTFLSHFHQDETLPSQRLPAEGTLRSNPNGRIPTNRFTGEPDVDQYDRDEFAVGYLLEHRIGDALSLRQNVRYYDNQVDDRTIFPTALLADQRTVSRALFESFGKVKGLTVDTQAQFDFTTWAIRHTLLAGLDYQRLNARSVQTFGAAPNLDIFNPVYGAAVAAAPVFKDEATTQEQIGFYLQDQIKFAEKWILSLGGRHDRASTETKNKLTGTRTGQDDSAFTGRAGLVYRSDIGLAPYVSYAESYLPAIGTDAAGQPFEPETGRQYEVGVKYQPPGWNSFVTLAYFDLTRENFLTLDPVTFANVQRGEVSSRGIELEGVARFDFGLNLIASYTRLDAEITKSSFPAEVGEPLEHASKHKASLWANYTIQGGDLKGLGFGAGVRHIGSAFGNSFGARNTIKVPGVTLFDAAVHYDYKQFRFAVNAQNVFDKEYVATAFTSGGEFATFGQRSAVLGTVTYRW